MYISLVHYGPLSPKRSKQAEAYLPPVEEKMLQVHGRTSSDRKTSDNGGDTLVSLIMQLLHLGRWNQVSLCFVLVKYLAGFLCRPCGPSVISHQYGVQEGAPVPGIGSYASSVPRTGTRLQARSFWCLEPNRRASSNTPPRLGQACRNTCPPFPCHSSTSLSTTSRESWSPSSICQFLAKAQKSLLMSHRSNQQMQRRAQIRCLRRHSPQSAYPSATAFGGTIVITAAAAGAKSLLGLIMHRVQQRSSNPLMWPMPCHS